MHSLLSRSLLVIHLIFIRQSIGLDRIASVISSPIFNAQLGPRPGYLVRQMETSSNIREELMKCVNKPSTKSDFSIGHRGAALQFPEHTRESYQAAIDMGAGIVECDVTFTRDTELVCRHSQCDLHETTNILASNLAPKCSVPPSLDANGKLQNAHLIKCCTSDLTLAEFKTLQGKMNAANANATSIEAYMAATPSWQTDLYGIGTLMTHKESIEMFKEAGVKMIPELKRPGVKMPFGDFTQEKYAKKLINEYLEAKVSPNQVFLQSFNWNDILYWIEEFPQFGKQAVLLDGRFKISPSFDPNNSTTWEPSMESIAAAGVKFIAPPMWVLLRKPRNYDTLARLRSSSVLRSRIPKRRPVPSIYSIAARNAGLKLITWTLERSGPLSPKNRGGSFYRSISDMIDSDGDVYTVLDVLTKNVEIKGIFSDWPATVTFYANCKGIN